MFVVVTGGSGSGKSAMAEDISQSLCSGPKIYAATMIAYDEESRRRIERHRKQRTGRQFTTLECPSGLEELVFEEKVPLILLECISNLVANELYSGEDFSMQDPEETAERIICGIEHLADRADHLVVVTNEMFQNGTKDDEMKQYLSVAGQVNRYLMEKADVFIEAVYGLPYFWKGSGHIHTEKGTWVWDKTD
nr:bifunctional adenosylcobinamide kinase/adenosylcobinamide-phosphate guanylyltransferase [uncultured Sellimonas sp.]